MRNDWIGLSPIFPPQVPSKVLPSRHCSLPFQVTDETAEVLMRANYKCALRGPIFVKGKGIITTYFAKTPFDDKKSNEPRIAENYQRM